MEISFIIIVVVVFFFFGRRISSEQKGKKINLWGDLQLTREEEKEEKEDQKLAGFLTAVFPT